MYRFIPATLLDVVRLAIDGRLDKDADADEEADAFRTEDWPYFWIDGLRLTGGASWWSAML